MRMTFVLRMGSLAEDRLECMPPCSAKRGMFGRAVREMARGGPVSGSMGLSRHDCAKYNCCLVRSCRIKRAWAAPLHFSAAC